MTNDTTVLLAALGIVSACVAGLIWIIKHLFNKIIPSIDGLTKATEANTEAAKASTSLISINEKKALKWHKEVIAAIGEIPVEISKTAEKTAKVLKGVPKVQKVDKQTVKNQIVNKNNK